MRIYPADRIAICRLLFIGLLLYTVGGPIKASSIYQALYQVGVNANNVVADQSGSTTVSVSIRGYVAPNSFYSDAQAVAGPNQLGVYTSAFDASGGYSSIAHSTASLTDAVSLTSAPSSGSLLLYVDVDGAQNAGENSPTGGAFAYTVLSAGSSCFSLTNTDGAYPPKNTEAMSNCGSLKVGSPNVITVPYANSSDVPFTLSFEAIANCGPGFQACGAGSSYLHTAEITSFAVEDANGNLVPGATVTSLSGTNYVVPEINASSASGSLALLCGILFIANGRRRGQVCTKNP